MTIGEVKIVRMTRSGEVKIVYVFVDEVCYSVWCEYRDSQPTVFFHISYHEFFELKNLIQEF